jgi:NADH-quinone oxidoreductase subunit L
VTDTLLSWILLAPLFSAAAITLVHLWLLKEPTTRHFYTLAALAGPGISAVLALIVAYGSFTHGTVLHSELFTWLNVGDFTVNVSLQSDPLSSAMLLFVAPVGFLIHIYAVGYMKEEPGYERFFAWFNLFMFFMLLLILADNPVLMFVGWEGVGLCSYALIGFYFRERANVRAGNKAFILNRIGDFGFLSALMLLFVAIGEHGFGFDAITAHLGLIPADTLGLIALLLFVGAMGKSAQIPLYVWLPDAMAGPTPVSALIHAATMVTAGVYMVARFSPLYGMVEEVGLFIAYIGAFSALLAALIATRQNDIKKILAYSTMSQLGYMFMAAGLGGYSLAIFHVFTHAFFKGLLFMGAGAVIVALHHEQDITRMGGLKRKLPWVYAMMLIATLALAAVPPFAGFFSKDAVMGHLFASGAYGVYLIALATSALTAFYMFRLIFYVFFGTGNHPAARVPLTMTLPMALLALLSIVAGMLNMPHIFGGHEAFSAWLHLDDLRPHLGHGTELALMAVNLLLIGAAIWFAYRRYGAPGAPRTEAAESGFARLVAGKFYVDELYDRLLVRPLQSLSGWFDTTLNRTVIDDTINRTAFGYRGLGVWMQRFHNGNVRYYALYMMVGVAACFVYLYLELGV